MTWYTHAGALATHQYVWVEPNALGTHEWVRGVWFGLTCYPGRAFGCHVLLECGAVYRNVPLHQLAAAKDAPPWSPAQAQTWDAYGWQFSILAYPFLASMNVRVRLQDRTEHAGHYLFTVVPVNDPFSAEPEQAKEFYVCELENGRYTAQPTNQVLIDDRSFVRHLEWPTFLTRQCDWYSAEDGPRSRT